MDLHWLKCPPLREDILNGNHTQLRDEKRNVAHQKLIKKYVVTRPEIEFTDRQQDIRNLKKVILPIIEYCTLDLVCTAFVSNIRVRAQAADLQCYIID